MPNKTIYLRDEDVALFQRAHELGEDSVSAVVMAALRRFVESEENRRREERTGDRATGAWQQLQKRAVAARASDIHLEPLPDGGNRVRFRIDGRLQMVQPLPSDLYEPVLRHLEELALLPVGGPGAGHGRLNAPSEDTLEVRLAVLPCLLGRAAVLRLLDTDMAIPSLDRLLLDGERAALLRDAVGKSHGLCIVTGPTGSGKTTTAYALLKEMDLERTKVYTIEDPVELRLEGAVQVPVDTAGGTTFPDTMRAVLRADPDVLFVSEIRDVETALLCVQAAVTGHRVLTQLHAPTAPGALQRLVDLGVEPFLLRDAVRAVVGQRLVRKLCQACRQPATAGSEAELGGYRPGGCDACGGSGYQGLLPLYEVLIPGPRVQAGLTGGADPGRLRSLAEAEGMVSLTRDGRAQVARGDTSLAEVRRVLGPQLAP